LLIDGHENGLLKKYGFNSVLRYMICGKNGELISDKFFLPKDEIFKQALREIFK